MTLRNLVQKVFSSKRAELWQCPKAKRVKQGTRVIHGAGPYIGVFSVGSVKTTTTVREALTLYGHQKFVVKSPSFNASIEFYYHLFTGKTGLEAALKWDETPGREYYAWTDSLLEAYIIHTSGKATWTYEQEVAKIAPKPKKTRTNIALKKTTKPLVNNFRNWCPFDGECPNNCTNFPDDMVTVLTRATRKPGTKNGSMSSPSLTLVAGKSAFEACVDGKNVVFAVNGVLSSLFTLSFLYLLRLLFTFVQGSCLITMCARTCGYYSVQKEATMRCLRGFRLVRSQTKLRKWLTQRGPRS